MGDKIELAICCPDCKGTGLYRGFAEKDGCAMVCYKCDGTGKVIVVHEIFQCRKRREGIKRVFPGSCGYVHAADDVVGEKDGKPFLYEFSKYGCTYEEWLAGVEPRPMEQLYCPYIFNNQGIGNEPLARCKERKAFSGRISDCEHFNDKAKCWDEYWVAKRNEVKPKVKCEECQYNGTECCPFNEDKRINECDMGKRSD